MPASSVSSEQRHGVIRVVPETDEIVAVCLEGEFDLANAPALGDEVDRSLKSGANLILDLSEATFIDASVINVLLQAGRTVAASGGKQSMVLQLGTAPIVERVLEIVKIEQVLTRAHDRHEAVRIIQKQRPSSRRNVKRHSHTIAHTVLLPSGAAHGAVGSWSANYNG
jgi:anti-anti-sigma factor